MPSRNPAQKACDVFTVAKIFPLDCSFLLSCSRRWWPTILKRMHAGVQFQVKTLFTDTGIAENCCGKEATAFMIALPYSTVRMGKKKIKTRTKESNNVLPTASPLMSLLPQGLTLYVGYLL